ncbi:secreted protein [Candidatus Omnitrophus magneticus]|uniref:Secreted protein n=1 Tax=Candidatus Omnitrophus magneticus TaxID=1609969 RepID=A0A0F0CSF8_9BACT|nr:secreted protein [Candidatus Omnitrophus magneticus]
MKTLSHIKKIILSTNSTKIFKIIILIWFLLWLSFFIFGGKHGQYPIIIKMHNLPHEEKQRYIMGIELYDFLSSCKETISEKNSYDILGLPDHSIEIVRARYLLWPRKKVSVNPDFKILWGLLNEEPIGYTKIKKIPSGILFKKTQLN